MRWSLVLAAALALSPPALAQPSPAQAAEHDALLSRLSETYRDVQAIQANFTQTTSSPAYGDGPAQHGQVTIARPRQLRIGFTDGSRSTFVSDGETLWVYAPDQQQVIITPDLSEQSDGLADLLQSLSSLEERFAVTALPAPAPGLQALSLAPKDGGSAQFKTLALVFDAQLHLSALEITDAFDTVTKMVFEDVALNPSVEAGLFTFTPPEGTAVIRTDQM